MALPRRDPHTHAYAELRTWAEDVRYALIDGVAYAMNSQRRLHQEILLDVAVQVRQLLERHPCGVCIAPFDARLPKAGEADDAVDMVVQPDLSVICDAAKLDEFGCRAARPSRATPTDYRAGTDVFAAAVPLKLSPLRS
jgi:Uma2 family endonuclease